VYLRSGDLLSALWNELLANSLTSGESLIVLKSFPNGQAVDFGNVIYNRPKFKETQAENTMVREDIANPLPES
jgi:hypothetical protein